MLARHVERVHKVALDAGFTCLCSTALPWTGTAPQPPGWRVT